MKRKIYAMVLWAGFFAFGSSFAQTKNVGIGTTNPDASAVLDIQSDSKGLLIPRMSSEQMRTINAPAPGLMVFQTGEKSGFYFYNGKEWRPLTEATEDAKSVAFDPDNWGLNGNIVSSTNFIGTTNNQPIRFKVNGINAGLIQNGNTLLGYGTTAGTGIGIVAIGSNALAANTTGSWNLAIGDRALVANTTGATNVGLGRRALFSNTSGGTNTAIGFHALYDNTTGNSNIAIGTSAALKNISGGFNIALGFQALYNNTAGNNNMAIGPYALWTTQGIRNTAIGVNAGKFSTGSNNIFIGNEAGLNELGSNKLYIAPTSTATPLIYGDFSAKYVTIGDVSPELRTQGVSNNTATEGYRLLVKGGILTEKVKVALAQPGTDWADYVFQKDYNLMTLEDVESFIMKNKHLPNVPSAEEMVNSGLDVAQTSKMFMEKIEELTLYIIELNKEIQKLKTQKY